MDKLKRIKRKLNVKKIFLFIFLIIFLFVLTLYFLVLNPSTVGTISNYVANSSVNNIDYDIIKVDNNPNYLGIGQQKVQGKDGYSTTFTTGGQNKKIYNEYKQNGTSSWASNPYWGNTMETDGCGITAMSIILSGYSRNYTPEDLRKKFYPMLNSEKISSELYNSFGISNTDFFYDSVHLGAEYLKNYLETDRPILICVWNKPNANRWTTESHYMVLLAVDSTGMVYISNPNGLDNTSKSSGWYDLDEITPYLAKALFIEDY